MPVVDLPGGIGRWVPVVVVSVAVLPLGAAAVYGLVRRRLASGVPGRVALRRSVAEVGMVVGMVPWLWMILTPLPARREIRLVPLLDIANLLTGEPATAFFQIVGNLLVFAAFGFFAPIRWQWGVARVVALAATGSIVVEILQYALDLGRVSSVDDVLLNAAGAGLAAVTVRLLRARVLRRCRLERCVLPQHGRRRGSVPGEARATSGSVP